MADQSDLYLQAERHHEERLAWHREAIEQYDTQSEKHAAATENVARYMLIRMLVELAILIVLIIALF